MEEQVVALWVAVNGYLDEVPVAQVPRFQQELARPPPGREDEIFETIRESGDISDEDLEEKLKAAVEKFKNAYAVEEKGLGGSSSAPPGNTRRLLASRSRGAGAHPPPRQGASLAASECGLWLGARDPEARQRHLKGH